MARRIRNIKPEFFEDEVIASLPLGARLFYIGLWTRCDMHGVFEWSIKVLTAAIFPHDDDIDAATVEKWLDLLVERGCIHQYEVKNKRWGIVLQFTRHQAISGKEKQNGTAFPLPPKPTKAGPVPGSGPSLVPGSGLGLADLGHMTTDLGRRTTDNGQPRRQAQPESLSGLAPFRGASQSISGKEEIEAATVRALAVKAEREREAATA
jgi:hypothetical protein